MKLDSKSELAHLKVDGGMTNDDVAMEMLADMGGFEVVRPEVRESSASGKTSFANQLRLDTVGFIWSHYCWVAVAHR